MSTAPAGWGRGSGAFAEGAQELEDVVGVEFELVLAAGVLRQPSGEPSSDSRQTWPLPLPMAPAFRLKNLPPSDALRAALEPGRIGHNL